MPDALSKTVPIWCAVMNRLLLKEDALDPGLFTPQAFISRSEHWHGFWWTFDTTTDLGSLAFV